MVLIALILAASLPVEDAEVLIREGVQLRRERRNEEALQKFEAALELAPSPRARAQVGLAKQALGRWVDAERDLQEALRALDDPWIAKNQSALEGSLAAVQKRLAWLDVTSNVAGAELFVDGTKTSTLPLASPVRVVSGEVHVELRLAGYEGLRRTIEVSPGVTAREHMPLVQVALWIRTATAAAELEITRESAPIWGDETLAYIAVGTGGALLAGAITANVIHQINAGVWNDNSRCLIPDRGPREVQCGGYRKRAEAALVTAIIGYGLSAATAGLGISMLIFAEPEDATAILAVTGEL